MPSLRELQSAFADGIFGDAGDFADRHAKAGRIAAGARFQVYRNNVNASLGDALADVYPATLQLTGEPFFRQTARAYLKVFPSPTGNLHDFGADFPSYLAGLAATRPHPYLPDVARLEWAYHTVFHAPDTSEAFDAARLSRIAEDAWSAQRFRLHPALELVTSRYPVLHIWRANQPGADPDDAVDLAEGGDRVLVARPGIEVEFRPLTPGEFEFLYALRAGQGLADAYAGADRMQPGFDLAGALALFIEQRVITGLRGPAPAPHFPEISENAQLH